MEVKEFKPQSVIKPKQACIIEIVFLSSSCSCPCFDIAFFFFLADSVCRRYGMDIVKLK